jgi:hypothetical protein
MEFFLITGGVQAEIRIEDHTSTHLEQLRFWAFSLSVAWTDLTWALEEASPSFAGQALKRLIKWDGCIEANASK